MPQSFLHPDERQRLTNQVLAGLYEFSGGSPRDRRVLVEILLITSRIAIRAHSPLTSNAKIFASKLRAVITTNALLLVLKAKSTRKPSPTHLYNTMKQYNEPHMKFSKLRNVLASLYPDNDSMRTIIYDSGLNLVQISLNSTPVNNWQEILEEAEKAHQLSTLLDAVKLDYGDNAAFQAAYNQYYGIKPSRKPRIRKAQKLSWPPLWQMERPQASPAIDNWWKSAYLDFNPFGPEQAERDPDLPKCAVYPDVLMQCLSGRRAAVVFGETGSGKSACARLLAYSCIYAEASPLQAKTYPVLHTIAFSAGAEPMAADLSRFFAYVLADSLVPFFVRNVSQFLLLPESTKLSIALCLVHGFGSLERVNTQLHLRGTKDSEERKKFLAEIDLLMRNQPSPNFSAEEWLEIFSAARPYAFEHTYLIVDVGIKEGQTVTALASYLQSLIDYWMIFEARNVYLKLLLPDVVRPHIRIPRDIVTGKLEWSEQKLFEMLHWRLRDREGRRVNFNELFDQDAKTVNPAKVLVEAAKGSPRRLIRVGNYLLADHVRQTPVASMLSEQSLERAIAQVAAEP